MPSSKQPSTSAASQRRSPDLNRTFPIPTRAILVGALLGAVAFLALKQGVGLFILPSLRRSLYWSSWYYLVPGLVAPLGAILGALTGRAAAIRAADRDDQLTFSIAGLIVILLLICFLFIALNNEIVRRFLLNPNGWTHNPLPSTTTWFLSYYGIPFVWSLILMWRSRSTSLETSEPNET